MTDIRPLTPRECVKLLSSQPVGRLAFSENALPTIRPVNFFLHNGDIIVRTSRSGSISKLTKEVVAFEVDSLDPATHTGWSVVVIGRVTPVTDVDELAAMADPGHRPWAGGERSLFLRIPVDIISGRILQLAATDAVGDAAAS
ncbi:pyridoxamine 5'-phosphate oxidase family protein [Amycolatopsis alkalitolerans]|uniref:Pyridoxamine 5'-phosphate oxidase family protein n=1 Tax=Amycolatopsis alkalitolerans TaxID=2547244 RepID=A0A5C4LSK4_9PSEU|nr:pyridoxamine 5'-phosphate oxidase family protein [Amycolatopsis alkalitolerans]TNC19628.1 pyridoxamine 5'-phosphate oxidase family protein [Amycolatopsis alkalitolerans]